MYHGLTISKHLAVLLVMKPTLFLTTFSVYTTTLKVTIIYLMFGVITLNSSSVRGLLTSELQHLQAALQANPATAIETTIINKWKTAKTPEKPCIRVWRKTNIGRLSQ